jgi:hypothetical protein
MSILVLLFPLYIWEQGNRKLSLELTTQHLGALSCSHVPYGFAVPMFPAAIGGLEIWAAANLQHRLPSLSNTLCRLLAPAWDEEEAR